MINKLSKIYIAGHKGMVGSALLNKLINSGYKNLIYRTSGELDLRIQENVKSFIEKESPDIIIDAAAIVGGIWANNKYPYQFLMDNLQIQNNLIYSAVNFKIKNFIFLGSSCIYPKLSNQPIKEEYLLTGPLEESNQWYAIAKIAGVKLIDAIRHEYKYNYISLMPTNLYGPNDNFDIMTSHVLPGMITKFHESKSKNLESVTLWGDGTPMREFLHVDDLADAIIFILNKDLDNSIYNIGSNDELTIQELANVVSSIVGYKGKINWDKTFPNGTPRKRLDSSLINNEGWEPKIDLKKGISDVYNFYLKNKVD
jgi:GDP-L-fucose synthase